MDGELLSPSAAYGLDRVRDGADVVNRLTFSMNPVAKAVS